MLPSCVGECACACARIQPDDCMKLSYAMFIHLAQYCLLEQARLLQELNSYYLKPFTYQEFSLSPFALKTGALSVLLQSTPFKAFYNPSSYCASFCIISVPPLSELCYSIPSASLIHCIIYGKSQRGLDLCQGLPGLGLQFSARPQP